jgi:hypothetical protein
VPQPPSRELLERLPRTFRPALNDQFRAWDLLFPAEQRRIEAQLRWVGGLGPEEFRRLFAPLVEIENRMDLPRWDPSAGLTVRDTGVLARSPLYPQWRAEVERVFSRIDEAVELSRAPRLVVCVLPSGLPLAGQALWPELKGSWVALDRPFGGLLEPLAAAMAGRKLSAGVEPVEATWIVECDPRLAPPAATVLCWTALAGLRREFLQRLNTIRRDLRSVDETHAELRRLDISALAGDESPRVREFVRSVLLSGNGSLVFNNSFVQWAASEALRRVQPQVLFACFGVRPRLKPFSSVVLFEDQSRSNPTPDEDDPAGSVVDALLLAEYVYLAARRLGDPVMTLLAAADLDRALVLGPPVPSHWTAAELTDFASRWLAAEG